MTSSEDKQGEDSAALVRDLRHGSWTAQIEDILHRAADRIEKVEGELAHLKGLHELGWAKMDCPACGTACAVAAAPQSSCAALKEELADQRDAWTDLRDNPAADAHTRRFAQQQIDSANKVLALPESEGHEWDRDGERCLKCGAKDWMGGECTPRSASAESDFVLIWSGEHRAWWRANGNGYTTVREDAGVYTRDDAIRRTAHCDAGKLISIQPTAALSSTPAPSASAEHDPWKEAVIDGLICAHIYSKTDEDDPRKALNKLLAWEQSVALDPKVSAAAEALIEQGRQSALSATEAQEAKL